MKLKKVIQEHRGLLLFVVLIIGFRSAIADWNYVPSGSMEPTILPGDEVFVNKMAYDIRLPLTQLSLWRRAEPEQGDIITFDSEAAEKRMVKRVIGLPGDEVSLYQNRLYMNGQAIKYEDLQVIESSRVLTELLNNRNHQVKFTQQNQLPHQSFAAVTIPEGYLLVLGDNRDNSADSRVYGLIPRNEVRGKVLRVIASLDIDDYFKPRSERFLHKLH